MGMQHVATDWGRMGYSDSGGAGVPLVFLHGTGCDSADWDATNAALPHGLRIVRVDFRGHGQSAVPRTRFTLRDLADDVLLLAKHVGFDRMVLVGHSLGGMVALDTAARSSQVAGIVLLEGWTILAAAEAFPRARFYGGLPAQAVQRIQAKDRATRTRFNPVIWEHFWNSVDRFDGGPHLENAAIPVWEVYGELGRTDSTLGELHIPQKPNIRLRWIADAGHYLPHESPAEVAAICVEAVHTVSPASPLASL